MNKSKKGFTLIELIVVLAILAVIMAIAVPTAFGSIASARESADRGSIDGFNSAIRMQSAFAMADETLDKTLGKAIEASGISQTTKAQSTIVVTWNDPTTTTCGYFEEDAGGTVLDPASPMYDQLIAIAKTYTANMAGQADGTKVPIIN